MKYRIIVGEFDCLWCGSVLATVKLDSNVEMGDETRDA